MALFSSNIAIPTNLSTKLKNYVEHSPAVYVDVANRFFGKVSKLYERTVGELVTLIQLEQSTATEVGSTKPHEAAQIYIRNIHAVNAVANKLNIQTIFIMQPMLYTKDKKSAFELSIPTSDEDGNYLNMFHDEVFGQVSNDDEISINYVDLRHVFNDYSDTAFIDVGHYFPGKPTEIIGFKMAEEILGRMK